MNLYRGCRDVTLQPRGFRETIGDSVRFTLRRVELMDAGRMTIEAKNLFGLERVSVSVKVIIIHRDISQSIKYAYKNMISSQTPN